MRGSFAGQEISAACRLVGGVIAQPNQRLRWMQIGNGESGLLSITCTRTGRSLVELSPFISPLRNLDLLCKKYPFGLVPQRRSARNLSVEILLGQSIVKINGAADIGAFFGIGPGKEGSFESGQNEVAELAVSQCQVLLA